MRRFTISIRWRSYRWTLQAVARSSADLVCAMIDYFPRDCVVRVAPDRTRENAYAEAMLRRDQLIRLTGDDRP